MKRRLQDHLESLFARCPDLCGFAVCSEAGELFVSDIGIAPQVSAEHHGEIYEVITQALGELLDEQPEARAWLRGRTFARTLH